jgi:hypothetical protein
MIGKVHRVMGVWVFDCCDYEVFADLLLWPWLQHRGGVQFEIDLPDSLSTTWGIHQRLCECYGAVLDVMPDVTLPAWRA